MRNVDLVERRLDPGVRQTGQRVVPVCVLEVESLKAKRVGEPPPEFTNSERRRGVRRERFELVVVHEEATAGERDLT
jgi:hypothetical protein